MLSFFDWVDQFINEQNEQESRKIVEMHRKEFNHQCRVAQPTHYENNTSNQPNVRLPDEPLKGTQHTGP